MGQRQEKDKRSAFSSAFKRVKSQYVEMGLCFFGGGVPLKDRYGTEEWNGGGHFGFLVAVVLSATACFFIEW